MTTEILEQTATGFELTEDQQKALDAFYDFLMSPIEKVFVLSGYSGCGKSTLVKTLLDRLPNFVKTIKLINPSYTQYSVELTATTNKAAENLARITGQSVSTIHSYLGLRVVTNFKTGETELVPKRMDPHEGALIFIDEASYIDSPLLKHIFNRTKNCKIVFVGDPAQLTPVKSIGTPVFDAGFSGAALTQVVRQALDNPIVDLSTQFRHTVNTGTWPSFKPDGEHVKVLSKEDFLKAIDQEFDRPDWKFADSKILGWTNKCVINYNHYVRNKVKGDPHFQTGDYAVCNSFIRAGKFGIKTEQLVEISSISADCVELGVLGNLFQVDHTHTFFMPKTLESKNARLKQAKADDDYSALNQIESTWIDLRAAYASTINKAQGSTFDKIFIDLDDVGRCNSGDQIARMMYVGASRPRTQLIMTGDLA